MLNYGDFLLENNKYPAIPSELYHGQPPTYVDGKRIEPVIIDTFDQNKRRFLKDGNYGFYFTPSVAEAFDYAEGGNVYMCSLNIKNPYYYEDIFGYTNTSLIKSPNFISKEDIDKLESNGYDGVVILNIFKEIGEVVALYPEQIKIIKML